jgi:general secretion pathway protein F
VTARAGSAHANRHAERFTYRAARRDGTLEYGSLEASAPDDANRRLAERGLFPLEVTRERAERTATARAIPLDDVAVGLRVLATLVESGLPVSRAMQAFEDLAPPAWRPGIPALAAALREGTSLGGALRASACALPPVLVGIIDAGEGGSGLAPALGHAATLAEQMAASRAALRQALAYPLVLALSGVGATALLVGVVLPRFAAILIDLGETLPSSTRLVLAISHGARAAALPGLVIAVVLGALWRMWVATDDGRRTWHGWLLALPLVGTVRLASAASRVAAALGALLESGVPAAPALAHAARASGDAAIEVRLMDVRRDVIAGRRLSTALDEAGAATPTIVRFVRAGEESGRLAAMLAQGARLERDRAERAVKTMLRLVEPLLVLSFGGMVALVAAALLQAVYAVRPGG